MILLNYMVIGLMLMIKLLLVGLLDFLVEPVTVIGVQKGRDTKENIARNFGLPHPEGYRESTSV